jgi:Glycosyltransferase 61
LATFTHDATVTGQRLTATDAPLLRIKLREAAPMPLPVAAVFHGDAQGYLILGGGTQARRRTPFTLTGPAEEAERLARLRTICADTSFQTAPLLVARLHHVDVDLKLCLCVTRDGLLVDETAFVASKIDPLLASSPLVGVEGGDTMRTRREVEGPVLHCFHRSSPAYGHFVLDGLVTLEWARDDLLAAGGKVLVPPHMPPWAVDAIRALGFPERSILQINEPALHCHTLIVSSAIDTTTTFRPDQALCSRLRQRFAGGEGRGRHIYLSRANQYSHSHRLILNEDAVRSLLVSRGFEVLEPGNMTIEAQAAAMAGASVVVGAHGSAFGNLVFAAPRTVVIDLMPADWIGYWDVDPPAERWVLNLTSALELDYRLLLCKSHLTRLLPDDDKSGRQKFGMEFTVDLGLLSDVLDGTGTAEPRAPSIPVGAGVLPALSKSELEP